MNIQTEPLHGNSGARAIAQWIQKQIHRTQHKYLDSKLRSSWPGDHKAALINTNNGLQENTKNISLRNKNKNLLAIEPRYNTYAWSYSQQPVYATI